MNTNNDVTDIIIVGDGLASAALLCSLRGLSLRILVLSREVTRPTDNRGLALSLSSKKIMEKWGIWADLCKGSQPIEQINVSEQNHMNTVQLKAADIGQPALGYVVPADTLYTSLDQAAQATPHQRISHREIKEIQAFDDDIQIRSDTADKQLKLRTRLLIAADGASSTTVRLAGADTRMYDYDQTAIVTDVSSTDTHNNTAYEHFTLNGPMAILPLPANRHKLVLTVEHTQVENILNQPEQEFINRFSDCADVRNENWYGLGNRIAYPLQKKRLLTAHAQGRWLALGNAAYIMHPNAAQGFNLCLRDIACLAKQLTQSDKSSIGTEQWLAAYHDHRRQDQARTALLADGLAHLYRSDHFIPRTLRQLSMRALNGVTPLRQRLLRQATGMAAF